MTGYDIHPTATSGDGKVIEQSRFIKKSDHLDNVVSCSQCGFYVDLDKRPTGDSLGAIAAPTLKTQTVVPPAPGISAIDNFGDPVNNSGGCPLCGSLNVVGKLRGKGFGTGISVENL
jgi:hypothetical protein